MLYRAYTPADRDACLAVFESNLERYFSASDRETFAGFIDDPDGFYGVLCDGGAVVGCGGVGQNDDRTGVLTWGMVEARLHGRGLGKALTLARLRMLLDTPGVERVVLNTSHETLGFYLKLGFRLVRHLPDGYRPGLDRCDMELTLDEEARRRLRTSLNPALGK